MRSLVIKNKCAGLSIYMPEKYYFWLLKLSFRLFDDNYPFRCMPKHVQMANVYIKWFLSLSPEKENTVKRLKDRSPFFLLWEILNEWMTE